MKVAEMAPHMEGILKLLPDLHITVARWRAQAPTGLDRIFGARRAEPGGAFQVTIRPDTGR